MYKPLIPWETLRTAGTDALAHLLVRQLVKGGGRSIIANNVFAGAKVAASEPDAPSDTEVLLTRLSDAWAWLAAHGFLGPELTPGGNPHVRVTQSGIAFAEDDAAVAKVWAEDRLLGVTSPALSTAKINLAMGEYETAAFSAMKAVEVAVRDSAGLPNSLVGVPLMRTAFGVSGKGALTDTEAEAGEQQATMDLFAGAIGAFKNPSSHRTVSFDDPLEVAEIIQLADLLLRVVERRSA
ncbi:TIGR02391 family protein [Demequina sp. NBRC 110057]|uniref:TIGR02391 family protein n=1 Tax=Demequina sp. NBRC 110057 TaxID=1570346 RepID=UPI000A0088E6|nr:TIGR02391 family protein [Demequina sp. NBRC 110057]